MASCHIFHVAVFIGFPATRGFLHDSEPCRAGQILSIYMSEANLRVIASARSVKDSAV